MEIRKSYRLIRLYKYFWNIFVNVILASFFMPLSIRKFFLKLLGVKLNLNDFNAIHSQFYLETNKLVIGNKSYVNRMCYFYNEHGSIRIGSNCAIGYGVKFHTTNHDYKNYERRAGKVVGGDIEIGDGTWIGAETVILSNVVIGSGVVIAAGSLITSNCENNYLYAGRPAKQIKKLKE